MTTSTLAIQQRLASLGFAVGPLDDILGRRTIAAIKAFQSGNRLVPDGIVGPLTIAALNAAHTVDTPAFDEEVEVPWIANLRPYIGLQEKRDGKKLSDYLDSDGSTVGDPAIVPWCGDLVQTALALTLPEEPLPGNPFYALNWAEWGIAAPAGMVPMGAVGTKERRDDKGKVVGGHVFFVVGHDATHVHALGGNQNNSICIARIAKASLFGSLRWPKSYPVPPRGLAETTIEATIAFVEGGEHVVVDGPVTNASEA